MTVEQFHKLKQIAHNEHGTVVCAIIGKRLWDDLDADCAKRSCTVPISGPRQRLVKMSIYGVPLKLIPHTRGIVFVMSNGRVWQHIPHPTGRKP